MDEIYKEIDEINQGSDSNILTFFVATDLWRICIKQASLPWYDQDGIYIKFLKIVCKEKFNTEHTLSCKKGGFITSRYNQVRGTTANLLKMICSNVKIEPPLLPLSGESLWDRTANIRGSARVDLRQGGFGSLNKGIFWFKGFQPIS